MILFDMFYHFFTFFLLFLKVKFATAEVKFMLMYKHSSDYIIRNHMSIFVIKKGVREEVTWCEK